MIRKLAGLWCDTQGSATRDERPREGEQPEELVTDGQELVSSQGPHTPGIRRLRSTQQSEDLTPRKELGLGWLPLPTGAQQGCSVSVRAGANSPRPWAGSGSKPRPTSGFPFSMWGCVHPEGKWVLGPSCVSMLSSLGAFPAGVASHLPFLVFPLTSHHCSYSGHPSLNSAVSSCLLPRYPWPSTCTCSPPHTHNHSPAHPWLPSS